MTSENMGFLVLTSQDEGVGQKISVDVDVAVTVTVGVVVAEAAT
jgi:hypothetical protein